MVIKICKWLVFSVLIASTPIIFNLLKIWSAEKSLSLDIISSHGQLMILAIVAVSTSLRDLFDSKKDKIVKKIVAGGVGMFLILVSSFLYVDITLGVVLISSKQIFFLSLIIFILAISNGFYCVYLSTRDQF